MKTGKSVQFKNIEDILTAYNSRGCPAFAIFQDKQFLFKYEGTDINEGAEELQTMCNALRQSAAIYTLAVYETNPGRITNVTEYDGSFNFRFQDNTDSYNSGSNMLREMNSKFDQMQKRIDEMSQEPEDEHEPALSGLDQVAAVLGHPLIQQLTPVLLSALGIKPQLEHNAAIAGTGLPHHAQNEFEISDELYQAICEMMVVTPDVEKHLIKLGNLAKSSPAKFKQVLGYMAFL